MAENLKFIFPNKNWKTFDAQKKSFEFSKSFFVTDSNVSVNCAVDAIKIFSILFCSKDVIFVEDLMPSTKIRTSKF